MVARLTLGLQIPSIGFDRIRWVIAVPLAIACILISPKLGGLESAAIVAIGVAATISGIAGIAFSPICGAMLLHLVPNGLHAFQLMLLCSIANQATSIWSLRRDIDWRSLRVFLLGSMFGLPIGLAILANVDRGLFAHAFGVSIVVYGAYVLLRRPVTHVRPNSIAGDMLTGFLGGITGGAAAFPGGPMAIRCASLGWDKARQRGVTQPFILATQIVALFAVVVLGRSHTLDATLRPADLLCIPVSILGTAVGLLIFRRLSNGQFVKALNAGLIATGICYLL